MVRFHQLSGNAWKRISLRLKKGIALVALAALVGVNLQWEIEKMSFPPYALAQNSTQCSDGVDNDGDNAVDMADQGCSSPTDNDEWNMITASSVSSAPVPATYQCNDGVDNDGDGLVDMADQGCSSSTDNDEWNIIAASSIPSSSPAPQVYQCNDGIDNDGDGSVDMADQGCAFPTDNDEWNMVMASSASSVIVAVTYQCNDGVDNDGDGSVDMSDPGCSGPTDNDEWNFIAPSSSSVSSTTIYYQCNDTIDNDGDGLKDYPQDPGCSSYTDNDEWNFITPSSSSVSSAPVYYQCNDSVDNDGDGLKDYPQDPGCSGPTDNDEWNFIAPSSSSVSSTTIMYQCSDNVDNDGDNKIDSQDPGCHTDGNPDNPNTYVPTDNDEWNFLSSSSVSSTVIYYQCNDTVDNDGDGLADINDPGCHTDGNPNNPNTYVPTDNDEWNFLSSSSVSSSSSSAPPSSSSSSSSSSSVPTNADMSITKSQLASVQRGNTATYMLTITNNGPAVANNVIVTDAPPNGFVFNAGASDSRCGLVSGQVRCALGSMAMGTQTVTVSFTVPVTTPCTTDTVFNTAIVSTSNTDPNLANNTSNTVVTAVTCPGSSSSSSSSSSNPNTVDLSITKTASPSVVNVNDQTVFTVTVYNGTSQSAQNVIVTDPLPSGLVYLSNSTTTGNYSGSQWSIGTLAAFGSATLQITARMNVTGSVTNTATVSTSTPESNYGNNTASATVSANTQNNQYGCIDIYKTAIDWNGNQIYSVPSFTFTLDNNRTVSNDSSGRARFDNVPAGTHYVTEYSQGNWRMDSISPNNGNVTVNANGSCATVYIRNRQTDDRYDPPRNDFTISKTDGRSTVHPGDRLHYTITVRNNNGNNRNNVTVRDTLPHGLTAVSASDNGRIYGREVRWDNVYIPAYGTRTFTLTADVDRDARGTLANRAEVNGRIAYDTDFVDEFDSRDGNFELTKDASTSEVLPGGMIEYTIRLRNNSNGLLRNIRVVDTLPENVTVHNDDNSDARSNGRLEWRIGSLSSGASRVIRYRISIGSSYRIGQFVRNSVTATADNGDTEHASAVVEVIGGLPQTGFMADLTGGGTAFLRPIIAGKSASSTPVIPLFSLLALAGLATGTGAGFLRKFVTGF